MSTQQQRALFFAIANGFNIDMAQKSAARASVISARTFTKVKNEWVLKLLAATTKGVQL